MLIDVWHIDNRSFWLGLEINWLTLLTVVAQEVISVAGETTMSKFTERGS